MKKRFKNILAKKGKKNGVAVLICTIMLTVSLGTLVGCSITKENAEDGSGSLETEDIQDENSQTDEPSPESDLDNNEHDSNEDESVQDTENTNGEQSDSAASRQDENMSSGMEERFRAILLGEGDFVNIDHSDQDISLNIENIKEVVSDEDWVTAKVIKFTIIDLDGNGENEIVLWIQANERSDYYFEILYFQDQEVYGFTLPYRGFRDLKTDGTFYSSGGMDNRGIRRLRLSERGYAIEDVSDSESQQEKTDVEWYDLTPDNVELAFENKF